MEGVLVIKTCLPNFTVSSTGGVLVMKNVSVKLFSFFSGGSIGDQERVCQTLQLHQWRLYWWWRTCLSISSASSVEVLLVIKNVSVKIFSFINGGSIGDQERVCQTLSASSMEGVLVMQERVCQTLQLHKWREYWWSRTCLSNSSASSMEGVLVIKNVSVKLVQLHQWRGYWWSRTCLSNSSASFNVESIGDQERVCQTLQLLQWREYWWSKRVCQILQLLQRGEYWWWRTCLSNSSASSMEGVLVMKNVSVKLFSFFRGGSIGDQERVCQTLQLHQWREYWWSRTCLSNSSASLM